MAKRARANKAARKSKSKRTSGQDELRMVRRGLRVVRALPIEYGSTEARSDRHEELRREFEPLLPTLADLRGRFLPDALVAAPCGTLRRGIGVGVGVHAIFRAAEPWSNLLQCRSLCPRCRGEAERALDMLEKALQGHDPGLFLSPQVIAARNEDASRRAASRNNSPERGDLPLQGGRTALRTPLSHLARAWYEKLCLLPETKGMTAHQTVEFLDKTYGIEVSEDRVKRDLRNELKQYGLENKRGPGYYIPFSKRPRPTN